MCRLLFEEALPRRGSVARGPYAAQPAARALAQRQDREHAGGLEGQEADYINLQPLMFGLQQAALAGYGTRAGSEQKSGIILQMRLYAPHLRCDSNATL